MDDADDTPKPPLAEHLAVANDAEAALIERLHLAVAMRLLEDWDATPLAERPLPMNRALISALARALGTFLGAVAANAPDNEAGWTQVVTVALEIARQTAVDKREQFVAAVAAGELGPPSAPYVFPPHGTVM